MKGKGDCMAGQRSTLYERIAKWELAAEKEANRAVERTGVKEGFERELLWNSVFQNTMRSLKARHKAAEKRLKRIRESKSSPLKGVGRSSMLGYD